LEEREIMSIIESILYVAGDPVSIKDLAAVLELTDLEIQCIVDKMVDLYNFERRGIQLLQYNGKIQFATRPEHGKYIEKLLHPIQKQTLSQAAMETLAIIAYRQPITRTEIEFIRGVKCDHSIASLMEKGLICEVGRKDTPGRPILYGTTDEFLKYFGLTGLENLPKLSKENDA